MLGFNESTGRFHLAPDCNGEESLWRRVDTRTYTGKQHFSKQVIGHHLLHDKFKNMCAQAGVPGGCHVVVSPVAH